MAAKRKANWVDSEIRCLVDECSDNHELITGKHGNYTESDKVSFWNGLRERINSIGGSERSTEEIHKKWKDLKSQTKKKEQSRRRESRKTGGGGPVPNLKSWEEKIIEVIPISVLEGIEDGIDLFQLMNEGSKKDSETVSEIAVEEENNPASVLVEVETMRHASDEESNETGNVPLKKKKRFQNEFTSAQLEFYKENSALCRAQRKVADQQLKTLAAQERFFEVAVKKIEEKELISNYISLFQEQ